MKKTVTFEDFVKMPEISEERNREIENFDEDFSDPENLPTKDEEFGEFRLMREAHPDWYKPRKKLITIRLDLEVIEAYKALGKGYQTRINADLRKALKLD